MKRNALKILVFARPCIGDVLLATPLLRGLRSAYPDAAIDALVPAGCESVLAGNRDIDRIMAISTKPGAREYLAFFRSIAGKYDIGITSSASDRAYAYMLLAASRRFAWLRPNESGGFWKRRVTSGVVDVDLQRHAVFDILSLGDLLGIERCYEVVAPHDDGASVNIERLLPPGERYAVLHLTPGGAFKRWSADGWVAVANHLAESGLKVVLTGSGSPDEASYVSSVAERIGGDILNLAGNTTLAELSELLRRCTVYIGVDTLTSHIAAAVGAPTIALFGPTSPRRWGPLPVSFDSKTPPYDGKRWQHIDNVLVLQGEPACDTCEQGRCRKERDRTSGCPLMLSLSAADVIRGIETMIPARAEGPPMSRAPLSP